MQLQEYYEVASWHVGQSKKLHIHYFTSISFHPLSQQYYFNQGELYDQQKSQILKGEKGLNIEISAIMIWN